VNWVIGSDWGLLVMGGFVGQVDYSGLSADVGWGSVPRAPNSPDHEYSPQHVSGALVVPQRLRSFR
jgi:hypothetical protein